MKTYEASLKYKRDWKNALDYATQEAKKIGEEEGKKIGEEEGRRKGRQEGRQERIEEGKKEGLLEKGIEIAKQLKKEKFPIEKIASITGLTIEEIKKLQD